MIVVSLGRDAKSFMRWDCFSGGYPNNMKRFVGNPELVSAAKKADGPGILTTFIFRLMHAETSL